MYISAKKPMKTGPLKSKFQPILFIAKRDAGELTKLT